MSWMITGFVIAMIGLGNLIHARKYPELKTAGSLRRLGWVGIICGIIVAFGGAIVANRPNP
jgi:hypothetical protein